MTTPDKVTQMAARLVELKTQMEELDAKTAKLKAEYDELGDDFIQHCKANDIGGIKINDRNVHFAVTPRAKMANRETAFEFFRSIGEGAIIKEDIHYQTLQSTVKDLCQAGKMSVVNPIENYGVDIYNQETLRIRRT